MEKKIQKKKSELEEAKFDRALRKVIYDSQIKIIEGYRRTIQEFEERANSMLNDFQEADKKVGQLTTELNAIMQELDNETEKT